MDFMDLINPSWMVMELNAVDKWEAIAELSSLLYENNRISAVEEYILSVHEREYKTSTGVGFGIGIPHGKSRAVLHPSVAFGKSGNGIEFDAIDLQPVYLVFLLAVPENTSDNDYLKSLSELARLLVHQDVRQQLMKTTEKEEVYDLFQSYMGGKNQI